MEILVTVGLLLLALAILVTIHELGHFLTAKYFGMRVETFALFFPPWIFKKKMGETEYKLGILPLGGFVNIVGMIDESNQEEYDPNKPPEPYEFRAKPAWQRLIVMLGGIIMNVFLGCFIFILLTAIYGDEYIANDKLEHGIYVDNGSAGEIMGFRSGDQLTTFMGEEIVKFSNYANPKVLLVDGAYFDIERDGNPMKIEIADTFLATFQCLPLDKQSFFSINYGLDVEIDSSIEQFSNAHKAGVRDGDKILAIDSKPVEAFADLKKTLGKSFDQDIMVRLDKDSSTSVNFAINTDFSGRWVARIAEEEYDLAGTMETLLVEEVQGEVSGVSNSLPFKANKEESGRIMVEVPGTKIEADSLSKIIFVEKMNPEALVSVQRGSDRLEYSVPMNPPGRIGIGFSRKKYFDKVSYSFFESIGIGITRAFGTVIDNARGLGKIFSGKANASKSLSGPIKIGQQLGQGFRAGGWRVFWTITGLLSMVLALMNLLPIPALDGGHVLFILIEMVTGREFPDKFKVRVQQIGMVFLLLLIVFILLNDIIQVDTCP